MALRLVFAVAGLWTACLVTVSIAIHRRQVGRLVESGIASSRILDRSMAKE